MSFRTEPAAPLRSAFLFLFFAASWMAGCATGTPSSDVAPNATPGENPAPGRVVSALPPALPDVSEEPRLSPAEAAKLIDSQTALRQLRTLTTDAMMGRDTRMAQIWVAARYIAEAFRMMGLEPMDEDGDFIDEFPITIPDINVGDVRMVVEGVGSRVELQAGRDFAINPALDVPEMGPLVLSPMLDWDWYLSNPDLVPEGSLVLAPFPLEPALSMADNIRLSSWMANVEEAGANMVGLVLPPIVPPEILPAMAEEFRVDPAIDAAPIIMLSSTALNRMLEVAGLPGADIYSVSTLQEIPVSITIEMPVTTRTITAPNVVARLPGQRAGELKDVVLTAHFDHEPPGYPNEEGDSIYNGSDDNASGTAGLLGVARAFSALAEPPARSVVFAAVSAEEMGLLGSAHLAEEGPAAAASTAANLNLDMLSRNGPDSLFVFGQTYSSLGIELLKVLSEHQELGLRVRPGVQWPDVDLIRFSDQASYLERGVPVLFFHSGFHPELHTPDDEVELADTDKLARAARLVFYTALAVANNPADPTWTVDGRARAQAMGRGVRR